MENLTILATENLTISDRLQETGYNSEEGLSNFLAQLAYHRGSSDYGKWPMLVWLCD